MGIADVRIAKAGPARLLPDQFCPIVVRRLLIAMGGFREVDPTIDLPGALDPELPFLLQAVGASAGNAGLALDDEQAAAPAIVRGQANGAGARSRAGDAPPDLALVLVLLALPLRRLRPIPRS